MKIMNENSVSRIGVVLQINDTSFIKCELKRHLSPKTVGQIIRALPLHGNGHFLGKSAVYFETPINSGIERGKKEFKKGDIAFLPVGKLICFFYENVKVGKEMTVIGKVIDNLDHLSKLDAGCQLKLDYDTGA